MLRLSMPDGVRLEDWQRQLVEALSRHMGMALGAARRSEQERLLALQEERSVIARELHDSLAQALSYMKIQVSLLQPVLADPACNAQAAPTRPTGSCASCWCRSASACPPIFPP
jgi:two-component system nitrate/nitrite sensor histidine kinase NarX